MDDRQNKFALAASGAVLLLWLIFPILASRFDPAGDPARFQPAFDAPKTYALTREFVTRFPHRVIGSMEARQSTGFLQKHLQELGYKISYSHFSAVIAGRRQVGRNIYAFKPGQTGEILAVAAHYDTAATVLQGATDNGSGVGVLLELARLAGSRQSRRGILFVASDGEEWGMLGARDLVQNFPERGRIVAAISLDYVSPGQLSAMSVDAAGQGSGYAPPWLRLLARRSVEAEGIAVAEPAGFQEHLERALALSRSDQGPFLGAGIPAVNLGGVSRDVARELEAYHSEKDTIENLQIGSLSSFGRAAERLLLTLEELPTMPIQSMSYFRAAGGLFVAPWIMTLLHCLAFAPLLLVACYHAANHRRFLSRGRIWREAGSIIGTMTPLLLCYGLIRLLVLLRRLPGYSLYAPPAKDPLLEQPAWGPLSGIFIAALLSWIGCYFLIRFLSRELPRPDFYVSKTILLAVLCALAAISLLYNSYWATSFLALPAWLWAWVGSGKGPGGRAANRLLIAAAGIPYLMVACSYAPHLFLGWKMVWYQVLAMGAGMFHWMGVLLASGVLTLGIRFLAIQSHSRGE